MQSAFEEAQDIAKLLNNERRGEPPLNLPVYPHSYERLQAFATLAQAEALITISRQLDDLQRVIVDGLDAIAKAAHRAPRGYGGPG